MNKGKEIIIELYKQGLIKTWARDKKEGWKLVSGLWSPFYIQLRLLPSYPHLLKKVGEAMGEMIKEKCKANKLLGIAMAGIPIATSISVIHGIPSCYTRKLESASLSHLQEYISRYGQHALIEGELEGGDVFVAVDDLVTKFDSKIIAIEQLKKEAERRKCTILCNDVAVLIDREQGGEEAAKKLGIHLHAPIPFKKKGIEWLKDYLSPLEYDVIRDYLQNPEKYQEEEKRHMLLKE